MNIWLCCLIILKLIADLIMGSGVGAEFIASSGAGQIYDMISWSPFTFLPAFIAVAGVRHFKCNPFIALWRCLTLTNPTWASIAGTISEGTPLHFLFVPLTSVTYTSTVIPPIVLVACLAWLERRVEKALPDVFKAIGTPFICAAVMVPLTIMVIGPVSTFIANALAAACFGVFVRSRNSEVKNGAASATGLFGITEPAIYGITLRFKKPFICGCIGASIGSMIASFFATRYFVYAGLAGFLTMSFT